MSNKDRRVARERLDEYILKYVDNADKSESMVAVGKGHGKQTTITFSDGSEWKVPPDFRGAAAP